MASFYCTIKDLCTPLMSFICSSGLNSKKDVAKKLQRRVMKIIKGVMKLYYIEVPKLLELIGLRLTKIKKILI